MSRVDHCQQQPSHRISPDFLAGDSSLDAAKAGSSVCIFGTPWSHSPICRFTRFKGWSDLGGRLGAINYAARTVPPVPVGSGQGLTVWLRLTAPDWPSAVLDLNPSGETTNIGETHDL